MKKLFAICLVVVLFSSGYAGVVDIYYDVDFSSPEHQVGFPPATGNSPTRPSRIVFGSPMVSTSLGALNDQPLVFNTTGNVPSFYYDQILFDVGKGQSYYYVAFDMFA
ncbi:MAG: hypothetical protein NTW55_05835 [Planctomycetota bacterium]|nr:hypothetical protein [Planctomycetota bacterium]